MLYKHTANLTRCSLARSPAARWDYLAGLKTHKHTLLEPHMPPPPHSNHTHAELREVSNVTNPSRRTDRGIVDASVAPK